MKAAAILAAATLLLPGADGDGSPVFGVTIPPGYRDWPVVSVAHEAGNNNDLRAIIGNDIAMRAFRSGTRPFPDGGINGRLAWQYRASPENDAAFGQAQSHVAGPPTNIQFSVKDSTRYAATAGWGYGQFEAGKPNPSAALMATCAPCHAKTRAAEDFVFTRYAP